MKVTRSDLRVRIMTILYQINIYEKDKISYDVEEVIKENDNSNSKFVKDIVYGVLSNHEVLDNMINKYLDGWKISRLGNIDQVIFRMSVYELIYTKTPNIVCINEGIELSKKYSDEKVTNMLNAVLDRILNNEVTNE
ncbi:n utilization substance protein B homolog [Clostridium sp. CAG:628]|jgi:transcription antitermination factor nusB|nr:n utilization substance protein B homolog [Clostridium sp. CAG:628]